MLHEMGCNAVMQVVETYQLRLLF
jgi:hypothetical protein